MVCLSLIHEREVEVADLLGVGIVFGFGGVLNNRPHLFLGAVSKVHEGARRRPIGWNHGFLEPLAVHVVEEIVLRSNAGVKVASIEAEFDNRLLGKCSKEAHE